MDHENRTPEDTHINIQDVSHSGNLDGSMRDTPANTFDNTSFKSIADENFVTESIPDSPATLDMPPLVTTNEQPLSTAGSNSSENATASTSVLAADNGEKSEGTSRRKSLLIGGISVAAVAAIAAGAIGIGINTNHSDDKQPPKPDPKATSESTPEAKPTPKTWQEDLQAAIEARPKTGQKIIIGDRAVTADDAKAWIAADRSCLLSGAVKFSSHENDVQFTVTNQTEESIRQALKTDENWQTCAGGLFAPGADSFNTGREFNLAIVNNQMGGRTVTFNPDGDPQIIIIDQKTVRAIERGHVITTQDDGTVIEDGSYAEGGTLQVQNGNLVWVDHF